MSTDPSQRSEEPRPPVAVGQRGLVLTSLDEMYRFARYVSASGLAPKGMERPETILVAVQLGLELGLSPMSALQNIAVINGRPGLFGDAALALVRNSGLLADFHEHHGFWCDDCQCEIEGEACPRCQIKRAPDHRGCIVTSTRHGAEPVTSGFNVRQAKRAGLWDKKNRDGGPSVWAIYPDRMLKFRARGFNLRDNFGDVLKGLKTTEELADYPERSAPLPPEGRQMLRGNGSAPPALTEAPPAEAAEKAS